MHAPRVVVGMGAFVIACAGASMSPAGASGTAEMFVVQGLPGVDLDIALDGRVVAEDVSTTDVVGPFPVEAGEHTMTVSDDDEVILERTMTAEAASSSDVVVHLPVAADTQPVVTVFDNDLSSVTQGKAAVTIAHTAAVPPADIRVGDQVLLSNLSNGESLDLTVPADTYSVEITPTGSTDSAILGPIDLPVTAGALNRVYAVGDPENGTMNVAVHVVETGSIGSEAPIKVNTGTGGQAAALAELYGR